MTIRQRTVGLSDMRRLLWGRGKGARYAPTSHEERRVVARIVPAVLAAARSGKAAPQSLAGQARLAGTVGLSLESWRVGRHRYVALVETRGRERGAGAYVFRVGGDEGGEPARSTEVILQAPHGDHDVGTGEIAARLFFEPPARGSDGRPVRRPRALFSSTLHRQVDEHGDRVSRMDGPADVCRDPDHLFSAATVAAASTRPTEVVQLHGFDDERGSERPGASIIVSAGRSAGGTPRTEALARSLRDAFGEGVLAYPEQIRELGGTTNALVRLLRPRDDVVLVLLELSPSLRRSLRDDAGRRAQFAEILLGGN